MIFFRYVTSILFLSVPLFAITLGTTCFGKQKSDSATEVLAQEDSKLAQSRTEPIGTEPIGTEPLGLSQAELSRGATMDRFS